MAQQSYWEILDENNLIFTGYTTDAGVAPATLNAVNPYKGLVEASLTANYNSAGTVRLQSPSAGWHHDSAYATPFAQAMVVTGITRQSSLRNSIVNTDVSFQLVAYDSAGNQVDISAGTSVQAINATTTEYNVDISAETVTVPAGGYLVFRVNSVDADSRDYIGTNTVDNGVWVVDQVVAITGPQATIGVTDASDIFAATGDVQKITATHSFKSLSLTPIADGTTVVAVDATTLSGGSPTILGDGVIAGGLGEVIVDLADFSPVVLIPDPLSNPPSEFAISAIITPEIH